ncbi:hypothetical protein JCM10450v2_008084 [Rhodotorula kratochvilovae]
MSASAQETTVTDQDSGLTFGVSLATDAAGDTATKVLSAIRATETTTATGTDTASDTASSGDTTSYTTYTENGSVLTWYATTPTTPVPSWSTGSVEAATASSGY